MVLRILGVLPPVVARLVFGQNLIDHRF